MHSGSTSQYHAQSEAAASPPSAAGFFSPSALHHAGLPFVKQPRGLAIEEARPLVRHANAGEYTQKNQVRLPLGQPKTPSPAPFRPTSSNAKGKRKARDSRRPSSPTLLHCNTASEHLWAILTDAPSHASGSSAPLLTKADAYVVLRARHDNKAKASKRAGTRPQRLLRQLDNAGGGLLESLAESIAETGDSSVARTFVLDLADAIGMPVPIEGDAAEVMRLSRARYKVEWKRKAVRRLAARGAEPPSEGLNESNEGLDESIEDQEELDAAAAAQAKTGLFNTTQGIRRISTVADELMRALLSSGAFRKRTLVDGSDEPAVAALLVRLILEGGKGTQEEESLPMSLSTPPREDARQLLMLLAQSGEAQLFSVIEALRRRVEGGSISRKEGLEGASKQSDFPTLPEAALLIDYYLQTDLQTRIGPQGTNQEQAAQAALKIYRGLVAHASPLRRAGLSSVAADDLLVAAKGEISLFLQSLDDHVLLPEDARTIGLTYRQTLRLAVLRLLLRQSSAPESARYMHAILQDVASAVQAHQLPIHQRAYRVHQMLSDLMNAVMQLQIEQPQPQLYRESLDRVANSFTMLSRQCILGVPPVTIRNFINVCIAAGASSAAADVLVSVEQAPSEMNFNLFEALGLGKQTSLAVLEQMADAGRKPDVQLLARHVSIESLEDELEKQRLVSIFARAQLVDEMQRVMQSLTRGHALSSRCMLDVVKVLDAQSSRQAAQIYDRFLEQVSFEQMTQIELGHTATAALIVHRVHDAERMLQLFATRKKSLASEVVAAALQAVAKARGEEAFRFLRQAVSGAAIATSNDRLLRYLPTTLRPKALSLSVLAVFETLWKEGQIELAERVFHLAAAHRLPLPLKDHPFALLRLFADTKPTTVAAHLQKMATPEQTCRHAGAINFMVQQFASNVKIRQGLRESTNISPTASKEDVRAYKLARRPNDLYLLAAFQVFKILSSVAKIVHLPTAHMLLEKLKEKGVQMKLGGGRDRNAQWTSSVDFIIDACRSATHLVDDLPISAALQPAESTSPPPRELPEDLWLAAASAHQSLRNLKGVQRIMEVSALPNTLSMQS